MPTILINAGLESDCVGPDDRSAGRYATEHLLAQGHQQVVWMDVLCPRGAAYQAAHHSVREREYGYRTAMQLHGYEAACTAPSNGTQHVRHKQIYPNIFDENPKAVFASLQLSQLSGLCSWQRQHWARPCPATVIISDENPQTYALAVDYVRLPWEQVGQRSVQLLQQRLHTEQPQSSELCVPQFHPVPSAI